jgi:hypothetical protein
MPIAGTTMDAVLAVPRGGSPVVVAVPPDVRVDLAGQPEQTAGELGAVGPRLVEATQSLLGVRIGHYVVGDEASLAATVDGMGGIEAEVEAPFSVGARSYRAGLRRLDGRGVLDYLVASPTARDAFLRWQDVLQGFFDGTPRVGDVPGSTDDAGAVVNAMRAGRGASVVELPTSVGIDGAVRIDRRKLHDLVATRLRTAGGPLVRVVVINGSGLPGVADSLAVRLAPLGYQVVVAENDSHADATTEVLASADRFVGDAQRVRSVIGSGSVYVDAQPTGLADVTIVAGKDLSIG